MQYKTGDLVKAAQNKEVDVVVHQCNCFNTMGSGIAKQLADTFPIVKKADDSTIRGDGDKLGTTTMAFLSNGVMVFNAYGQYAYGKGGVHTSYGHLLKALCDVRLKLERMGITSITIGMPRIGAGLGGGDWNVIEKLIEAAFLGTDFDIVIYTK